MPSRSVLVVGGGLAGLSSAVALAEAGWQVRLLEKRPHLGGRATSYTLPDGSEIDNCQHVTLGCCTNLADFYGRVGAQGKIHYYGRLHFADAHGRISTIEAVPLPPPLHMAPSFAMFGALTLADKRGIASAMLTIARAGGAPDGIDGLSMRQWLESKRQTRGAIDRFWRMVLVSALDEELPQTDARYGIDVFWKGFLASRQGYLVGIPSVPLGKLYEGCREAIERRGGEVKLRCGVRQIRSEADRFMWARLDDGSEIAADACVLAVPHDAAGGFLAAASNQKSDSVVENLHQIKVAPITGVHLWFDRTVMTQPFLTLLDHRTQWVFNKSALLGDNKSALLDENKSPLLVENKTAQQPENTSGEPSCAQYLQLVISASYDLVPKSRQEIIDLCMRELGDVLPETRRARLVKGTVVKEVSATFSPEPGVDRLRPAAGDSGIRNLFLAGDWTKTGWPATMEGAVRSGYLAAESLLSEFGQPRNFLCPDLPPEGLCKIWAGRRTKSAQAQDGEASAPRRAGPPRRARPGPEKETARP
ncbi:MAG: hydroxysqualene dehydroxylase HpnE [Candidatus Acidiferrales bacterium]